VITVTWTHHYGLQIVHSQILSIHLVIFVVFSFTLIVFNVQILGGEGSTARFKVNADNLGKFVIDPTLKVTYFEADVSKRVVTVGWIFSSQLKLPWRCGEFIVLFTFHE